MAVIKMAEFKLVISEPKTGKTMQKEVKDDTAKPFLNMKLGDTVKGELIDMTGYEFQITGGSDHCGFPMRVGVPGQRRKKILISKSLGFRARKDDKRKGIRRKRTVCGDAIHSNISQINMKVTKVGAKEFGAAEKPAEEGEAKRE